MGDEERDTLLRQLAQLLAAIARHCEDAAGRLGDAAKDAVPRAAGGETVGHAAAACTAAAGSLALWSLRVESLARNPAPPREGGGR